MIITSTGSKVESEEEGSIVQVIVFPEGGTNPLIGLHGRLLLKLAGTPKSPLNP